MGSDETATATTGGPRVIDVFDGNGAPSGPNCTLFSGADRLPRPPPAGAGGGGGSRSTSEKSVQFGPDGAPFPSKTAITRGPPVVAVAVSLDPILPQR